MGDVDNGEAIHEQGQDVYGKSILFIKFYWELKTREN